MIGDYGPYTQNQYTMRKGNIKRAVWLKSCWLYSEKLSQNKNIWLDISNTTTATAVSATTNVVKSPNAVSLQSPYKNNDFVTLIGKSQGKTGNMSGLLEMTIYASLANHINVLLSSPLISSPLDKIWVIHIYNTYIHMLSQ